MSEDKPKERGTEFRLRRLVNGWVLEDYTDGYYDQLPIFLGSLEDALEEMKKRL